ncbi:hypothetical protein GIB67_003867 [Kingdonia uniflora]|uniref:DUF8039 domain-containing protein n=1 Tax=Kingdonia uniflora TaxID=39325 RepID=A0A7J7LJR8_9MAGN|nr:hypothetical protein GIB67_003867 [Kingdonia uniflora]
MDRRNSTKKMTPVQIDIAGKAKRVVENLGTTNNLNPRGQPVGEYSVGYNRYLGVIVREVVPITFATRHDVGNEFSDRLWTMIKDWQERKVQKGKVIDIEDDLEQTLSNCPEDVPYDQWEVFAEQYTTSEYKDQIDVGEVNLTVLFGPERTGRVKVIGFDISPMVCNSVQQSGVLLQSLQEEVKELREEVVLVQGLKDELALLRVQMAKLEKFVPNQISVQDETTLSESNRLASQGNHIPSHPVKCKLLLLTPSNVVATGHWYNEEPTCKVHNVPFGIGMSKVSIQISLKEDVPLARENDHLKTIRDACGSFVAWLASFIIKE